MASIEDELRAESERLRPTCTCTGAGLRIKLAAITGVFEHARPCPRRVCACGHLTGSHHGGECYGCTGPECDPEMRALAEPLDLGGGEGVVKRGPLFYDGYCIRHAERDCEWCRLDAKDDQ